MIHSAFVGSFPAADFRLPQDFPEVAVLGRSNVGKSSLLNALTGRRALARISRTPGRTRGCNVFSVEDRFYYVDLPGYGYALASQAERRALSRLVHDYVAGRGAAALWLLDVRREPTHDDLAMGDLLSQHSVPVLVALTKADKLSRGHRPGRVEAILDALDTNLTPEQCVLTSARTGEGIPVLRKAVERMVGGKTGRREVGR